MRVFSQLLVWVVGVRLHDIFSPHLILFTECFETLPARLWLSVITATRLLAFFMP